jgi:hypothetical protein
MNPFTVVILCCWVISRKGHLVHAHMQCVASKLAYFALVINYNCKFYISLASPKNFL